MATFLYNSRDIVSIQPINVRLYEEIAPSTLILASIVYNSAYQCQTVCGNCARDVNTGEYSLSFNLLIYGLFQMKGSLGVLPV